MAKTTKPAGCHARGQGTVQEEVRKQGGRYAQGQAGSRRPGASTRRREAQVPSAASQEWPHPCVAHPARAARRSARRAGQRPTRLRRNYLLPQGLATFATPHNLLIVEKHRQQLKKQEEARRADLQSLGAQIATRSLTIEANANEEGHLYGSVNADQIAAALKSEGFPIETESVRIEGPLKDLGLYTIKVHLAQDIDTEVKLWVVPTHTDEAAPSA